MDSCNNPAGNLAAAMKTCCFCMHVAVCKIISAVTTLVIGPKWKLLLGWCTNGSNSNQLRSGLVAVVIGSGRVEFTATRLQSFPRSTAMAAIVDDAAYRTTAIGQYRLLLAICLDYDFFARTAREKVKNAKLEFEKTEDQLKVFQSCGQKIGEVVRQLDDERFIVKLGRGPRHEIVGCHSKVNRKNLTPNTRVCLDPTTHTIMRTLPREVDPIVYNMLREDPGNVSYSAVGGLSDQIRELRECIELPLMNPDLFLRVGIKPPKGVLLYGPPGTGKTLLARAIARNIDATFMKPCIIFMDEIDAIGGRRFSVGSSADREIQRTLMELLNQLDGFDELGKVKIIMANNRPDVLDPALLQPGRLDRKIEIPLPNEHSRLEILKIHAAEMAKHGEIDYEAAAKLAEGFNAADMRNVCTEAGMSAIRAERDYVMNEDFMKAVRKLSDVKKLESSAQYNANFGKN